MPQPEQRILRNDLFQVQRRLAHLESMYGKDSPEYRQALQQLARVWSVLRMTRSQQEFFHEVVGSAR